MYPISAFSGRKEYLDMLYVDDHPLLISIIQHSIQHSNLSVFTCSLK